MINKVCATGFAVAIGLLALLTHASAQSLVLQGGTLRSTAPVGSPIENSVIVPVDGGRFRSAHDRDPQSGDA